MLIEKPPWVSHDGMWVLLASMLSECALSESSIYSVDIHSDGKRFVTAGGGIWKAGASLHV